MIGRLRELFRRYCADHLTVTCAAFALNDETGQRIGHLDRIELAGGRFRVTGWTLADRVILALGGSRVETTPNYPRPDVTSALDLGQSANVGFTLDQPFQQAATTVTLVRGNFSYVFQVPPLTYGQLRRAQVRLLPGFALAVLRASPMMLRWWLTRDLQARAAIKTALGLNAEAHPASGPMSFALFGTARESARTAERVAGLMQVPITIILPVYNAFDLLAEVLDRVLRHTDLPWRMILVEDCSSDARVRPFLRDWVAQAAADQVTLLENEANLGFIRSVNRALDQAVTEGRHVVLLNSDALVPAGWASRLLRPILAHDDVATVTPMSNDAEIFSVPVICQRTQLAPGQADAIDRVAAQFNPDACLAVAPTGVGFCLAMNIDYLARAGQLDTAFGRGYGEEVDWCQRARKLGGRHLGLAGLFVEHRGGTSFGSAEKLKLVQANNATIASRYPSYDREVQAFIRADPLGTTRLALAIAWAAARTEAAMPVYLAHSLGGGADKYLAERIAADLAGGPGAALVLRVGGSHRWRLELHCDAGISFGVTDSLDMVTTLLAPARALRIIYSCGVGDRDPSGLPAALLTLRRGPQDTFEVLFHDFFPLSPSYCLLDQSGQFRGVPGDDDPSPAHTSRRPDGSRTSLGAWRKAWGVLIAAASDVVVFSKDSRAQVLAVYPFAEPAIRLRPHGIRDLPAPIAVAAGEKQVIGVLGNIGQQKGAAVLVDLSRRLEGNPDLSLVLVGNIDPFYTLAASVKIHGTYRLRDLPDLVARYGITCWLIPSVWPETFCYAMHEVLATGMPVYCFDLGAQAEIARTATNAVVIAYGPAEQLAGRVVDVVMRTRRFEPA